MSFLHKLREGVFIFLSSHNFEVVVCLLLLMLCALTYYPNLALNLPTLLLLCVTYLFFGKVQRILHELGGNLKHKGELQDLFRAQLEGEIEKRSRELVRVNTELLLAKEDAESAAATRSIFLSHMSASFRTPLMGILLYSDLLHEALTEDGPVDKDQLLLDLDKVVSSANHLLKDIDRVLDFAQIEGNSSIALNISTISLDSILCELRSYSESMSPKNQNVFEIYQGSLPTTLRTDTSKLFQVFYSVLENAFKFTQKGLVTLRVDSDGDFLTLVVADTGCGIPLEKLKVIDSGLANSLHRGEESLGLSLALSKRYLTLLGGILIIKTQVNQGTVVTVKVPLAPLVTKASPETALIFSESSNPTNLVTAFTQRGYWAASAPSLDEFFAMALSLRPNIAVLVFEGSCKDTWDVILRFKLEPTLEKCRLILAPTNSEESYVTEAREVLPKPVQRERLARILTQASVSREKPYILIIEDDRQTALVMSRQLDNLGWPNMIADSSEQAQELLKTNPKPSLILLDLILPGMSGFDFLDIFTLDSPVVVVTGKTVTTEDIIRLNARPAIPMSSQELIDEVLLVAANKSRFI